MKKIFQRIVKKTKEAFFSILKDEAISLGSDLFGNISSKEKEDKQPFKKIDEEEPIIWVRENGITSSPRWNVFCAEKLIGRVLHREKLDVPKQWKLLLFPQSSSNEVIYFADKDEVREELVKRVSNAS
jgi:hypothetical protein